VLFRSKLEDKLVILLDLDRVLASAEYDSFESVKTDDFNLEGISGSSKDKKPSLAEAK
jgi:hypothetical protein